MGACCTRRSDVPLAGEFHNDFFRTVARHDSGINSDVIAFNIQAVGSNVCGTIRSASLHPKIVVAIYDYPARTAQEVSFIKGDRMEVLNDSETDWSEVRNLRTQQEGFIPSNYVAVEKSVESEDWFFGKINRKDAERLLIAETNPRGSFLIRNSEHNPGCYSLSVKDWDGIKGHHVKHYKIKSLNGGFGISLSMPFPNLHDLVQSYARNAQGLCYTLTTPCPRPRPQIWDLSHQMKDNYEIDRDQIKLIRVLGKGNFGEVWYGIWNDEKEVAVKTLRPGTMSVQAFLEEASIMKKFRHTSLVTLYAVCTTEEPIYIVQEYLHKGALLDYLRNDRVRDQLTFDCLVDIAAQVASGMGYLEKLQLIHRDLAARNILIGKNNEAKICDFGLARTIEDDEYNSSKQGSKFPVKWTAPEAMIYGKFTIKSDVWSYGILLMEIFTYGHVPYPGMSNYEVMEQIQTGYRMANPINPPIPEDIYEDIMLECWNQRPEKRPTFEYLHHFFENFSVASEAPYRDVS